MQRENLRWFATEDEEKNLKRSRSPFRGKRNFEATESPSNPTISDLDTSTSTTKPANDCQAEITTMADSNSGDTLTLHDLMAGIRNNGKTLENLQLSVDEMRGELHTLRNENDKMKHEIEEIKSENEYLHGKIHELEHKVNLALAKANNNEQYSRRNNFRMYGVPEEKGENVFQVVADIIVSKLKDMKDFRIHHIDAAHRLGSQITTVLKEGEKPPPRPIIVRLGRSFRDRIIRRKSDLKGTRMSIIEDLTKTNFQLYHSVKSHEIVESIWTTEGKIMILVKQSQKVCHVKSIEHLKAKAVEWTNWKKPTPRQASIQAGQGGDGAENQPQPQPMDS